MPTAVFSRRLLFALAGIAIVLTLTSPFLFHWDKYLRPSHAILAYPSRDALQALSSLESPTSECPSECPMDPFVRPGMVLYGSSANGTRWVPFPSFSDDFANESSPLRLEGLENYAPLSDDALLCASEQYMLKMVQRSEEVRWASSRLVLFIGSSHDRNNINWFCEEMDGIYTDWGAHTGGVCTIPWLKLTIAHWFLYGMVDDESYDWFQENEDRPITFEKRIPVTMLRHMREAGLGGRTPDLVVMASLYWEEHLMETRDAHIGFKERSPTVGFGYAELRWHRSRMFELVYFLRHMYGSSLPLMLRARHMRNSNWGGRLLRMFQLDQSCRAAAEQLGVRIFGWGDLLEGYTDFSDDDQHFNKGPSTWLFGDMMLFYLRQAITPGCWGCS